MSETTNKRERIDELGRKGYRIIQDTGAFCFGMDAVLLADFARAGAEERILDLGTGSGILPLLLLARDRGGRIDALELQPAMAGLARRNAELNGLSDRIRVTEGNIREASAIYGRAVFDAVVTNPPYMAAGKGMVNPDSAKAVARHELFCSLDELLRETATVLKPGGSLYMVHRPRRLPEVLARMQEHGLEPKELRLVHPFADAPADLFLVRGVRGAKPWLKLDAPLIVYREKGEYTDEIYEMYFGKSRREREETIPSEAGEKR